MKNKVLSKLSFSILGTVALTWLFLSYKPVKANATSNISTVKSYYCMSEDGNTCISSKNEKDRHPIASMCKIMTLLLTFDEINAGNLTFETEITVSDHAMSMGGSQVYLNAGDVYTVDQLIESVVVCSANDSCVALAEKISGNDANFVTKMNEKAKELGCNDTLFANCTGLPKDVQYSCARDVAVMLSELIKNKEYYKYCAIRTDDFKHPDGRTTLITNTNKLVNKYPGCDAGKTGYTQEAGFCLAATAKREDMRVISVCIGAKSSDERFDTVKELFEDAFANYTVSKIVDKEVCVIDNLDIFNAKTREISVFPSDSVYFCHKKGEENNKFDYDLRFIDNLKAPINSGTAIGTLTIHKDGVEYKRIPLTVSCNVEKAEYFDYVKRIAERW